jgi:hypothetical protein
MPIPRFPPGGVSEAMISEIALLQHGVHHGVAVGIPAMFA